MIIFPAVDIRKGQAVRLEQGRMDKATIFDDPYELALKWREAGSQWLHVIDLDGAIDGKPVNAPIIGKICHKLGLSIQIGGGIRSADIAQAYLDAGASRLIIGTMALEQPGEFVALCRKFPGKIGVSLDADNARLKSRGWLRDSGLSLAEVLPRIQDAGAAFVIYTDIARDGMRQGINMEALGQVLRLASLPVIAAGGVASMEDVKRVASLAPLGKLEGLVSGRAICDGSLDLREAITWLQKQEMRT